jgi:hypothetical protein
MCHAVSRWVIVLATAGFGLLVSTPARAAPDRVTQGEAEAILSAYGTGGQILRSNGTIVSGAPADADAAATIRPFGASDGRHYCADDWHVIVLALIDGGDASYTRAQAEAFLGQLTVTFTLDRALLPTDTTPIKPYLDPESVGLETGYWYQEGTVMSPESLSVGKHTLEAVIDGIPDANHPLVLRSTFYIDASGTGACL